jgi:hypothetical protein
LCSICVPVVVGVLIEAASAGEDDQSDLNVTEDGELVRLLQQPVPTLAEGHLAARRVLDPLDLNLTPPHPHARSHRPF